MSYELSYSDGGFLLRFEGNVTNDELNMANGEIHGHEEFDSHRFQVVDVLDADLSLLTEDDAALPAETDAVSATRKWHVKVALIVAKPKDVIVVDSYVAAARQLIPHWEFGVFSTRENGMKWVNS